MLIQPTLFSLPDPLRCSLCGAPYGRPDPSCCKCDLRRNPLPVAPPDPAGDAQHVERLRAAAARLTRVRSLGRPVRVGLVGCSASKRPGSQRARDLYTGNFFRRALPISEASCDETWILSAHYGILSLQRIVETYDAQLSGRQAERAIWGQSVITSLHNAFVGIPLHLAFFAGAAYVEAITGVHPATGRATNFNAIALTRAAWTYETPLRGLERGRRFAWFHSHAPAPNRAG